MLSRRSGRRRSTLAILVLLSLTVVTLDFWGGGEGALGSVRDGVNDVLAPARDVVAAVVRPIGNAVSSFTDEGDLRAENQQLREKVAANESAVAQTEALQAQLEELRSLLNIDFVGDLPTVVAQARTPGVGNFDDVVEIDRGSDHGVAVDNPVVTAAGLVGRVVSVSPNRAQVKLITSTSSGVGVRFPTIDELGLANGQGSGKTLTVAGVHKSPAEVMAEQVVYTSGQVDSLFPAGIPVGRVASAVRSPGETRTSVEVEPLADLESLDHVAVIAWTPQPGP